jgi:predicted ATPase with chaperone activity
MFGDALETARRFGSEWTEPALKIARTVSDLDASAALQPRHVTEAIQYRSLDRRGV